MTCSGKVKSSVETQTLKFTSTGIRQSSFEWHQPLWEANTDGLRALQLYCRSHVYNAPCLQRNFLSCKSKEKFVPCLLRRPSNFASIGPFRVMWPFASDMSPKWIDIDGLTKSHTRTTQMVSKSCKAVIASNKFVLSKLALVTLWPRSNWFNAIQRCWMLLCYAMLNLVAKWIQHCCSNSL